MRWESQNGKEKLKKSAKSTQIQIQCTNTSHTLGIFQQNTAMREEMNVRQTGQDATF